VTVADSNGRTMQGGASGYGWQPGQSGNPGGRPKGIARLAREATRDGVDLVAFFVSVFHGVTPGVDDGDTAGRDVTLDDRIEAARWLADRGFGKAAITVSAVDDEPVNVLNSYSIEGLFALKESMDLLESNDSDRSHNDPSATSQS
jgi:hypothetical protein